MQEKSKPVDNLRADAEKIITRAIAAVLPDAAEDAEAAVEADAAPPQAARLSAIAPARKADTRRFIYKFLPQIQQKRRFVLPLYHAKLLNCDYRIARFAPFGKRKTDFFAF